MPKFIVVTCSIPGPQPDVPPIEARYEVETSTTLWLKNGSGETGVYPFHAQETVDEIWAMLS